MGRSACSTARTLPLSSKPPPRKSPNQDRVASYIQTHQAADIIHPDLAFAGGFTGTRKIADYAMIFRTPVALHNVGSLVLCCASAHFGSAIFNFYRSESALGRPTRHVERMSGTKPPEVEKGCLTIPEDPGLGFVPDEDYLKSQLMPGEPFWS